ncbi:protein of unknown function [Bartonella clarridgeiae 73]|uniref:Uncharacterized protein n=1 Tax=Bartonella clarridgeiae (strain CCUG 45776 / CIP 104772 / 73) TaxID=696125 RepID=E6YGZ3_BARC7|nr:protein of unknown function [Bartonella clarridgeiae 73]
MLTYKSVYLQNEKKLCVKNSLLLTNEYKLKTLCILEINLKSESKR